TSEAIKYPRFIKLIIANLMKKFPNIPQRIDEDYHSIEDDIPLVSVYTTRNVLVRGMLIPNAFLTEEICATDDIKEYETMFMNVVVPMNQPQLVVSTQGTHRSTHRAHRTHTLTVTAEAQENKAKVQEKLDEEEIEKMVEDDEDEESYASEFADSMLMMMLMIPNDEEIEKEKNDDNGEKLDDIVMEKDDDNDVEKVDEVVKEKDIDVATGSMGFSKEKMQTPIPSPTKSPRKVSSSDKIVSEEFTATIREVLDHCNKVVPEMTIAKTNEIIKREMPRMVNLAVTKDREVHPINAQALISQEFATYGPKMIEELFRKHMQNTTLNLYSKTSSLTVDLQQQLYLNMKSKPQDQVADPFKRQV
ncbi:hypothetical protein Tco_1290643, partial [Tanacetum coccineum]